MSWKNVRVVVLVAVLGLLLWVVRGSVVRVQQLGVAGEVCGALRAQDANQALALSADIDQRTVRARDTGLLEALECRCLALVALGRGDDCSQEISELVSLPQLSSWVPSEVLAAAAIDALEAQGDYENAVRLAVDAAAAYPDSILFHSREFRVRMQRNLANPEGGSDDAVLALLSEFEQRLQTLGSRSADLPLLLADRYSQRHQWRDAVRVLGAEPPTDPAGQREWFILATAAFAGLGDAGALARMFDRWEETAGASAELTARRALLYSQSNLMPTFDVAVTQLSEAVRLEDQIEDDALVRAVRRRLIRTLVAGKLYDAALTLFDDTERKHGEIGSMSRSEILALVEGRVPSGLDAFDSLADMTSSRDVARRETVATVSGLLPSETLVVSPPDWTAPEVEFSRLSGRPEFEVRRLDSKTSWYAVLDRDGRLVAEGAFNGAPGQESVVQVARREEAGALPSWALNPLLPGDGQRRLVQLILDSADWRVIHFLVASGRLPAFTQLMQESVIGSLISQPPYTAAALQALIQPGAESFGVLELVHELGTEFESLNFVGHNPVAKLELVLPRPPGLFEVIGAGDLAAVNLLRSTGALRAGRNATVVGPRGLSRQLSGYVGRRALSVEEVGVIAELETVSKGGLHHFEETAADFDTLQTILEDGEIDYILARVASLDLITHGSYGELVEPGPFSSQPKLLTYYQYVDLRLGQLRGYLDQDDVLIVMSDHGAHSSLQHDPVSVFLISGEEFTASELSDRPPLAAVSRVAADLLGVATEWPGAELSAELGIPSVGVEAASPIVENTPGRDVQPAQD